MSEFENAIGVCREIINQYQAEIATHKAKFDDNSKFRADEIIRLYNMTRGIDEVIERLEDGK